MNACRRVAVVALVAALFSNDASAQVAGKVVTESGQPLPGARVELRVGAELRIVATTGPNGSFFLSDTDRVSTSGRVVRVRRIGYRPATVAAAPGDTALLVVLPSLPTEIAQVLVKGTPTRRLEPCSREPSAEASAIYAAVAAYYRGDTRWLDRIARYAHAVHLVHARDREVLTGLSQRGGWTRNAGLYDGRRLLNHTAVPRQLSDDELRALPFPVPERKFAFGKTPIGWLYPKFHEWGSPSFVSRAFIDSMPKSVVSRGPDGIVLAFCPRDRQPPYTSGEIELSPNTIITAIRWQFSVVRPGEDTGGFATFAAPESKRVKSHLLPVSATSWTFVPRTETFEVTEYAYRRWVVAERGDSIGVVPPP